MSITTLNAGGKQDMVVLKCVTWKQSSNRPCGMQANAQCFWKFQGPGCVVYEEGGPTILSNVTPASPAGETVTVSGILGNIMQVTTPNNVGPDPVYHRGYFERNGLKISIQGWDPSVDVNDFVLVKAPPQAWLTQQINLHQGCDKTITTCVSRFDNENQFGGFGISVQDYHVVTQIRENSA